MIKVAVLLVDNNKSSSSISKHEPMVNPIPFLQKYEITCFYLTKANSLQLLSDIYKKFALFLNLCDGAEGDDRPGIEVVTFLEQHHLPFTGAGSDFYEPTRVRMKEAAVKSDVLVPAFQYFFKKDEISSFKLSFPCMVKHFNSYSSIGITKKSVVYDKRSLKYQVERMLNKFKGAMIEEYIKGREYTVLVVSTEDEKKPFVFEPAEVIFPENEEFKHFDLKWKQHQQMKYVLCNDTIIADKLKKHSSEIYKTIHGTGYARFDYRLDADGNVYFLELNPNCSLFYPKNNASSADEILFLQPNGHQLFTDFMLNYAKHRFSIKEYIESSKLKNSKYQKSNFKTQIANR
jgi:D-alanine-D-alanine ligase